MRPLEPGALGLTRSDYWRLGVAVPGLAATSLILTALGSGRAVLVIWCGTALGTALLVLFSWAHRRRRSDQRGSVIVFTTIWVTAVLMGVAVLSDGARLLNAHRRAFNLAEAAARAGSQEVDADRLRGSGLNELDPAKAEARAMSYLSAAGYPGTASATPEEISVQVSFSQPPGLLALLGLGPRQVVGTAASRPVQGVTTEGD